MKLSVCTDAVFSGKDLIESCREVLNMGLDTIEFWNPEGKDIDGLVALQKETNLKVSVICTDFISLTNPSFLGAYRHALEKNIKIAKRLGCKTIISQTGSEEPFDRYTQHKNIVNGLKSLVPMLEDNDIMFAFEPLNIRVDHPGYYLQTSDECVEILNEVGSNNVKMLFDIYHQQITEGDIIRRIQKYSNYITHFHTAGNPGRHELYYSELDYRTVFKAIEDTGYDGYVGLEYFPVDEIKKGIEFAKSILP